MNNEIVSAEQKQAVRQQLSPVMQVLMSEKTRDALISLSPGIDAEGLMARARLLIVEKPDMGECDPGSILLALKKVAASGLSLNGRDCHILSRWNNKKGCKEAQFQIDYKGYIHLAKCAGLGFIKAEIVHERDEFTLGADEHGCHLTHTFRPAAERGKPIGAYSMTKKGKIVDFEWMTEAEIYSARERSSAWTGKKGPSGPWVTDPLEMWKKTVLRRHSKRWQLSPGAKQAIADDDDRMDLGAPEKPKARIVYPTVDTLPAPEAPRLTDGDPTTEEPEEFKW